LTYTDETEAEQISSSRRLRIAIILGALSALAPLSIDMYLPSLPALTTALQTNTSLAQLSLTCCLLGLALGQLFAGPLSDRFGRRSPLIVGLGIYAISSVLCAFVPSIWWLIVLRLIQGTAGAAGIVISRAVVRDMYSGTEMTRFFSLLMLINGVAPILAPVFGGQLLRVTSWRGVFIVLGILGVAMLIGVLFGLPESLPEERRATGGVKGTLFTFGGLLADRTFMGYALSQGLVMAAMFGYISGSPFVLQNIFGVSPQMFSVCFAINGLGIIIASQISGRLAARVGETKLLIIGLTLAALGGLALLLMILLGEGLFAILPPLFVLVSSVGVVATTSSSLAMQNQGKAAGSAAALLGVPQLILGAVAAPLVGLGGSHAATPMGVVIAIADVGAGVCYMALARRR
jgi:DHA1 family bicyclomycin/chloramphenicol resistance-like MFS transporter